MVRKKIKKYFFILHFKFIRYLTLFSGINFKIFFLYFEHRNLVFKLIFSLPLHR
ncbi:hypothetical protein ADIS_2592 [Lunatimonas lonarensis]|uniref:Uncharacterized protein n=1 Tax=Lunatimonas lonarensis TaxID=1232681 RepID=R7ZS08_9BACT|nr:hypothetical protein ADIS_2592 [Lunatimonas lonarensis]